LAYIGRLVGDEFSKGFFLAHFSFGSQKIQLNVTGLPDAAASAALLRELRSLRGVLDAQPAGSNTYQVELPEGNAADIITEGVLKPLNAKLGQACLTMGAVSGNTLGIAFSQACGQDVVRGKLETAPPAGLLSAPPARGRQILRT
jgi:serine/threonine-protein kinase